MYAIFMEWVSCKVGVLKRSVEHSADYSSATTFKWR